jgi:PKD repeat protein
MQNPEGIVYPTPGTYNVQLRAKNSFGFNILLKEDYITVGTISVKNLNSNRGIFVYPNPSSGVVNVRMEGASEAWTPGSRVEVSVLNASGAVVYVSSFEVSKGNSSIDLSGQPDGLYVVRIASDSGTVQRKVSLVR